MSTAGADRFRLPSVRIPVAFVTSDELTEDNARVDTVIIEPEERRFSLLAKAEMPLPDGPPSIARIVVGKMSDAIRDAIETGVDLPEAAKGAVNE